MRARDDKNYELDRASLRTSFARAASTYDEAAVLQREVANRLLERLDLIRLKPGTILDAGCGTGYCARALKRRYPRAQVMGLDIATPMLAWARRQRNWFRRTGFVGGDIERLPMSGASLDMVFSNLALQWCDLDVAFAEFARVLRPGGVLMFTTFGPDTLKELRTAWQAVDSAPHVHTFIDMHDVGDALMRARLGEPVMDVERLTITYTDVLALMRDLKAIGSHNAATGRVRGLTGKTRFARFRQAYESHRMDGRIPASYEVVFGHAWAPAPAGDPGSVRVPLETIRRP